MNRHSANTHLRRMLTKREAAIYCGVPINRFPAAVSVPPISMPHGKMLYDIKDLDNWLDRLKTGAPNDADEDILSKLG